MFPLRETCIRTYRSRLKSIENKKKRFDFRTPNPEQSRLRIQRLSLLCSPKLVRASTSTRSVPKSFRIYRAHPQVIEIRVALGVFSCSVYTLFPTAFPFPKAVSARIFFCFRVCCVALSLDFGNIRKHSRVICQRRATAGSLT